MPHKFFLSFLGAIPYHQAHYYWRPDQSDLGIPMDYVQEAIIRKCLPKWEPEDKVFIFTTEEAYRNNYEHKIRYFDKVANQPVLEERSGLLQVLENLKASGIIHHFEPVMIPNGYTEQEILEVFQRIFNTLDAEAEIYFDITFGFRSLPMLGIVLLNYASNVIGAEIKAIYYGNYEAGRAAKQKQLEAAKNRHLSVSEIRRLEAAPIQAPILNLLSLSILQEWTAGAREFIHLGKTGTLANLVKPSKPQLAEELLRFEEAISTCRGMFLTREFKIEDLKAVVADSRHGAIKEQLKPLITKIEEKITTFETGNTLTNGFAAVEWCLQHNMIQQGITFLQETLVSFVLEQFIGTKHLTDHYFRELTGAAIKQFTEEKNNLFERKKFRHQTPEKQEQIRGLFREMRAFAAANPPLTDIFLTLNKMRNDVNHCGFQDNYAQPQTIKNTFENTFQQIKAINLHLTHVGQPIESSIL